MTSLRKIFKEKAHARAEKKCAKIKVRVNTELGALADGLEDKIRQVRGPVPISLGHVDNLDLFDPGTLSGYKRLQDVCAKNNATITTYSQMTLHTGMLPSLSIIREIRADKLRKRLGKPPRKYMMVSVSRI